MDRLAFDPKGIREHGLVYTILSHIKDIKSLYLLSKLEEKIFSVFHKVATKIERFRHNVSLELEHSLYSLQKKKIIFNLPIEHKEFVVSF